MNDTDTRQFLQDNRALQVLARGGDVAAVVEGLKARGVRFLFAQFSDLHGVAKGKLVPVEQLGTVLRTGAGFAGPSIAGFDLPRHGDRAEYFGRGDLGTLQRLPWQPDVARIVCDGFVGGQPYEGCPRQILRRTMATFHARGWTLNAGIEPEFFLFDLKAWKEEGRLKPVDALDRLDKPSYDHKTLSREPVAGFLADLSDALRALDFEVLQIDHEDAAGQFEVNYAFGDALQAADRFMLFKMAASVLAERHGMLFSLMPKPFEHLPGSGLHFHLSIRDAQGRFIFDDGEGGLSAQALHAVAGVLHHGRALSAVHAPTVNSYKRLVAGASRSGSTWAPVHLAWGHNNRTTLVRTVGNRLEWRLPDGSCNLYVALATVAAAFLDGMDTQRPPPAAADSDLYDEAREALPLPGTLGEALHALATDAVVMDALGADFSRAFLQVKGAEWEAFRRHVSDWEIRQTAGLC